MFTLFPHDNRISVSKNGIFYNNKTKKELKKHVGKTGYYCISITSPGKKLQTYKCHRILAMTFHNVPEEFRNIPISKLNVNHKDGVKLNISLNNLEWVTSSGNADHAYQNGLNPNCKAVQVKNNHTGEITVCYSGRHVSKTYGIKSPTLFKHLNSDNAGKVNYSGYSFRFLNDSPWPDVKKHSNLNIKFLFINNENKSDTFNNLKSFTDKYCLNYNNVYRKLIKSPSKIRLEIGELKVFGNT